MCHCPIITLEYVVIVDGTVAVSCGECGKYQYHLVSGEVQYLAKAPKVKCARPRKTKAKNVSAAERLRTQEHLALKQLEAIRQEIEKYQEEMAI